MEINKNTNTNFTGTFIFRPESIKTREAIPNVIKKGRQIFYNIKNEGDVVIVTKDKYDKYVGDFINSENVAFSYYPEISTKSGLDDQVPSTLQSLLNIKNNCVVRNLKMLNKFLLNNGIHLSKQSEYLQEAMNTLRLNIGTSKVKIDDKGVFVIRDEAKKRTIKSTGFRGGIAYIHVIPDSISQETKRFLIGRNGKEVIKEYNTPNEILYFYKIFKKKCSS